MEIVAYCQKCGLGYVYMNPKRKVIPCLVNTCDGKIRRIGDEKPKKNRPTPATRTGGD